MAKNKGKKVNQKKYHQISARVLNKPLLLEPSYGIAMMTMLAKRLGFSGVDYQVDELTEAISASSPEERNADDNREYKEWMLRPDGTAVVPIEGTLMHSGTPFASLGRTYNAIVNDLTEAHAHEDSNRVVLLGRSNGGEVSGCSSSAEMIRRITAKSDKPTWAYIDENAYSAGYWSIAPVSRIVLPDTGGGASIGVVRTHADYSKVLERQGVDITFIHSGAKKVQGNPYEKLSSEDLSDMQAEIEFYGDIFYNAISHYRDMSYEDVKGLEAATFIGKQMIDVGLADDVMNKEDFFNEFASFNANKTQISTGATIVTKEEKDRIEAENIALKAENDRLKSEAEAADQERKIHAEKEARKNAVMGSDEAKGREEKAQELLEDELYASFPAEAIIKTLSSMVREEPETEDQDEDEDLGADAKALLAAARRKTTPKIVNRGESTKVTEPDSTKGRRKNDEPVKYATTIPQDREEMMAGFLNSAKKVGANLKGRAI